MCPVVPCHPGVDQVHNTEYEEAPTDIEVHLNLFIHLKVIDEKGQRNHDDGHPEQGKPDAEKHDTHKLAPSYLGFSLL